MRYSRTISDRFQEILKGPLAQVLAYRPELDGKDDFLYDFQLREKDELMVYCGTSRVVVCKHIPYRNSLRVHAAPTYQAVTADLMGTWDCGDDTSMNDLADLLLQHLRNVDSFVPQDRYRSKKEGYWQNRICVDYGRRWESDDAWLIVDREVVVGFSSTEEKTSVLAPIVAPYEASVQELRGENPRRWGRPRKKSFGDELDLLAIDKHGNLLCVELKHGDSAAGVYWGMYQAAVYRGLAMAASGLLVAGATALARQKIELGLLPESARYRLQKLETQQPRISAVLAVAQPKRSSSCWANLVEAVSRRPEAEAPLVFVEHADNDSGKPSKVTVSGMSLQELQSAL